MKTALGYAVAILAIAAFVLMVSSFAPLPLSDFGRFTLRVVGFSALVSAFIAHVARDTVWSR